MLARRLALEFFLFFFFQAEDGIRDLTVTGVQTCALPISIASVLVVPADSALQTLEDALAQARQERPLLFASCGNGTPQHLAGEMLARDAKRFVQHVPYKGCGPAITAVAAGQVAAGMVTASR